MRFASKSVAAGKPTDRKRSGLKEAVAVKAVKKTMAADAMKNRMPGKVVKGAPGKAVKTAPAKAVTTSPAKKKAVKTAPAKAVTTSPAKKKAVKTAPAKAVTTSPAKKKAVKTAPAEAVKTAPAEAVTTSPAMVAKKAAKKAPSHEASSRAMKDATARMGAIAADRPSEVSDRSPEVSNGPMLLTLADIQPPKMDRRVIAEVEARANCVRARLGTDLPATWDEMRLALEEIDKDEAVSRSASRSARQWPLRLLQRLVRWPVRRGSPPSKSL